MRERRENPCSVHGKAEGVGLEMSKVFQLKIAGSKGRVLRFKDVIYNGLTFVSNFGGIKFSCQNKVGQVGDKKSRFYVQWTGFCTKKKCKMCENSLRSKYPKLVFGHLPYIFFYGMLFLRKAFLN